MPDLPQSSGQRVVLQAENARCRFCRTGIGLGVVWQFAGLLEGGDGVGCFSEAKVVRNRRGQSSPIR